MYYSFLFLQEIYGFVFAIEVKRYLLPHLPEILLNIRETLNKLDPIHRVKYGKAQTWLDYGRGQSN